MKNQLSPARQHAFGGCLRRRYVALAATGALLLLPAAAQAATKDAYAGPPPKGALKGVPPIAQDNSFYPKRMAVRAGDSVRFRILGFHNVLFAPRGTEPPSLFVPNPEAAVTGAKDPAGADLWFNGQPQIVPNPGVFAPAGRRVIDDTEIVGSGVTVEGAPKPFKVKFPRQGTYTLLCSIHPGMKIKVDVKRRSAKVPTARQDARRMRRQANAAARLAKRLMAGDGVPSSNVVRAGNDRQGVATIAFFPATKTVKVGEPVRFELSRGTTEIHSVAFGPQDFIQGLAQRFLGPQGLDPMSAYPSDPPGTALMYDAANHGNGFLNTGILDPEAATPNPDRATITFTKPGTYRYYCIVHGAQMKGTIEVTS
jgi:plastocyanin